RYLLLATVFVQRVRAHPQVLRSLADIHHFSRVGHSFKTLSTDSGPATAVFSRHTRQTWEKIPRSGCDRVNFGGLSISQPGKCHCRGLFPCFLGFYACFLEKIGRASCRERV